MKIAIIGAGLSGLSAASALKADNFEPTVFDKGRHVGGRCATRPTDWGTIDHGVQLLDSSDKRLIPLLTASHLELEDVSFDGGNYQPVPGTGPFVRPANGARSLAEGLARSLTVLTSHTITRLEPRDGQWHVFAEARLCGSFDAVILAIPPAQAAAFNLHQGKLILEKASYSPQVAALIAHHRALDLPPTGPLEQQGLAWISKSSDGKRATILSSEPLSSDLMDTDKDEIAALLWDRIGGGAKPNYLKGHRWRYCRVSQPMVMTHFWDPETNLGYCGDWFIGPNAGDAVQSGTALADAILNP